MCFSFIQIEQLFVKQNFVLKKALLVILTFFKNFQRQKKYHNFRSHFRSKILLNKRLSDLNKPLTHNYQIPFSKNFKVWAKLNNFLLNKIFVPILILFLLLRPYLTKYSIVKHFDIQNVANMNIISLSIEYLDVNTQLIGILVYRRRMFRCKNVQTSRKQ